MHSQMLEGEKQAMTIIITGMNKLKLEQCKEQNPVQSVQTLVRFAAFKLTAGVAASLALICFYILAHQAP